MRSLLIASFAAGALMLSGVNARSAQADSFGIHVAGPGYHFDIGRAHGHRAHHGHHRSHRSYYRGDHHGGHRIQYGHRGHGGHGWHDTSHFDYHPGGLVPHYDHYDYAPGHWDYHQEGHLHHYHW